MAMNATNKIGEEQVKAAKLQYSPIFTFRTEYEKDPSTDKYTTEFLSIENQGYPILNYQSELKTILTIKKSNLFDNTAEQERHFLIDYYIGKSSSNGGKGQMSFYVGHNNLSILDNLSDETQKYNKVNEFRSTVNYETNTIIKITYIDAADEPHSKFFIDGIMVDEKKYDNLHSKILSESILNREDITLKLLSME
jgi:hypothetical protein